MRGDDQQSGHLFSYLSPEQRVPADHPLRAIRQMTDEALRQLSPQFEAIYATSGRPSVPPEQLLRALLLQALYTVRSERLLVEQLEYNLLFRWFVGLGMDDAVWTPTTFTKNRERLLAGDIARQFFAAVLAQARGRRLLSDEHFTVDGTLLDAWAGQKSFTRKDGTSPGPSDDDPGNPTVNFRGERRSNTTHQSTTDPDSRLAKTSAGTAATLAYLGEVLMDNRHGLVVDACVRHATGTAEREAATALLAAVPPGGTVGADKLYDTEAWVATTRQQGITPHVAQKRRSAIDRRTTRHPGYALSQRVRKRVEEIFGWMKTVGGLRQLRHRGRDRVAWHFLFVAAAYNLVRLRNLPAHAA
jgi:transposase